MGILFAIAFLREPVVEGSVPEGASPLSRGGFVLSALVYPEAIVQSWSDAGRLPLAFSDRLPLPIFTALWLGLAVLIGRPWSRVLCAAPGRSDHPNHLSSTVAERLYGAAWSLLIGLAWLSTATLCIGLAGGLALTEPVHMPLRAPLVIMIAAILALSLLTAKWWAARCDDNVGGDTSESTEHQAAWLTDSSDQPAGLFDRGLAMLTRLLVVWLAVVIVLGAWVPSAEFDVMEYHLQAPREFYEAGVIGFMPHNIYANMPLGTEMHTLAAMTLVGMSDTWWSGLIGKSITAAISLLGPLLLGSYFATRHRGPRGAYCGWCAAGIWLASPGIAHVAMLGLIDGAVATYVLASVLATFEASQRMLARQRSALLWWFIASVMAGAAAAAKYPGLIFAVVPLLVAILTTAWLLARRHPLPGSTARPRTGLLSGSLKPTLLVIVGLATTCLPWYAKNAIQAGNPFYPLAASFLGGETLTSEKIAQWQAAHRVPGDASEMVSRLFGDVWRLMVASPFAQPTMVLGFCLAAVLLLVHYRERSGPWKLWLAWSVWILLVWWCATHRIDRFWLPVTGLTAGLATVGTIWLRERSLWLAHALVILGLGYGALINSSSVVSDNRYFVALDALRNDTGDQQQVGRVSQHLAWINQHLSQSNARLLMIGEAAVFEYQLPFLYSTCFDKNPGEILLRDRSLEEQRRSLDEQGITHVLINWREINRYRSPGNYGFSDWPHREDIQELVTRGLLKSVEWPIDAESVELLEVVQ